MQEILQKHIFLIGFMGAGKSAIAKGLEKRFGCARVEMDQAIEEQQNMTINEIFAQRGEEAFRQIETEFLKEIAQQEACVVSCGGGVVLREENIALMKQSGTVIYLSATPETIYERVHRSTHRPLLNGHMDVEYIAQMLTARLPHYQKAMDLAIVTDEKSKEDIVSEIAEAVRANM